MNKYQICCQISNRYFLVDWDKWHSFEKKRIIECKIVSLLRYLIRYHHFSILILINIWLPQDIDWEYIKWKSLSR